ncbi:hypothetical protein AKJ16_DCAP06735 [Drosera capensis]
MHSKHFHTKTLGTSLSHSQPKTHSAATPPRVWPPSLARSPRRHSHHSPRCTGQYVERGESSQHGASRGSGHGYRLPDVTRGPLPPPPQPSTDDPTRYKLTVYFKDVARVSKLEKTEANPGQTMLMLQGSSTITVLL